MKSALIILFSLIFWVSTTDLPLAFHICSGLQPTKECKSSACCDDQDAPSKPEKSGSQNNKGRNTACKCCTEVVIPTLHVDSESAATGNGIGKRFPLVQRNSHGPVCLSGFAFYNLRFAHSDVHYSLNDLRFKLYASDITNYQFLITDYQLPLTTQPDNFCTFLI